MPATQSTSEKRPRCGAFGDEHGTTTWRVWAPRATNVELILFDGSREREAVAMTPEPRGHFFCALGAVTEGQRYAFRLDGGRPRPDPASRWQPDGVHHPSAVVFPERYRWEDTGWRGIARQDLVIYELHVGTFTPEGTLDSAISRLAAVQDLGITAIELMPLSQFPGSRGWGYDGVHPYAVQNSYGGPQALLRFVDACHQQGMAVILDVVYNHLGPEGNYLNEFGPYFCDRHHTPWGQAVNYDDAWSDEVRAYVLQNVAQWIGDFHIDGLRLDAVHTIYDMGPRHILREIKETADAVAAETGRTALIIAESDLNDVRLLDLPDRGGYGLDGQWSDDFHHCVHTLLTGEHAGYYADYGMPEQLAKALNDTFVYDGEFSLARNRRHGASAGNHPGEAFVVCIQNHDQVGNRARGDRFGMLLSRAQQRLAAGLLLLSPHVPLLFMGEEYGETRPFPFFCSFLDPFLIEAVRDGRRKEFSSFAWMSELLDPQSETVFESAKLGWSWPEGSHAAHLRRLYRDLLTARRLHQPLRDFTHREAELCDEKRGTLIHLTRGSPASPASQFHAWFNLSPETLDIPRPKGSSPPALFWSESPTYGGARSSASSVTQLLPYEFVLCGVADSKSTVVGGP